MTLFLTDHAATARELRSRLGSHTRPAGADDARGEEESRPAPDAAVIRRLPSRFVSSAALTGSAIASDAPEVVVVVALLNSPTRHAPSVVYRLELADEAWMPDVTFAHAGEGRTVSTATPWGAAHDGEEPARVSPAAAGAFAGALSLLAPHQVVGVVTSEERAEAAAELAITCAARGADAERAARARTSGGDHVSQSVRLGDALADRLRLTATQRARFLKSVRSAAVRSGRVPAALATQSGNAGARKAVTKHEAKRRLAEMERLLDEWADDES